MEECNFAEPLKRKALDNLCDLFREAAIKYWRAKVCRDFTTWYTSEDAKLRLMDKAPIREAGQRDVERAAWCSWWDWDRGSAIFFWIWPKDYQRIAREGAPPMFIGHPPSNMNQQLPYKSDKVRIMVKIKSDQVISR